MAVWFHILTARLFDNVVDDKLISRVMVNTANDVQQNRNRHKDDVGLNSNQFGFGFFFKEQLNETSCP